MFRLLSKFIILGIKPKFYCPQSPCSVLSAQATGSSRITFIYDKFLTSRSALQLRVCVVGGPFDKSILA